MAKPIIIYHGNCIDGFAAAWCFYKEFGESFEYHPGHYGEEPPDVSGRDVVLVDFSYKKPIIQDLLAYAKSITIIDHHKSAIEDLKDFKHYRFFTEFDLEHSGAMLAWKHVFATREPPKLLKHIEDRDLWKFKLEHTREIIAALFSYEYSFDTYTKLMEQTDLNNLIIEGRAIERKHWKDIKELLRSTKKYAVIGAHKVPVANMPYTMASDAANAMAKDDLFAACYTDVKDGRIFQLRSVGEFDVSKTAVYYKGGGHKNAAGFKVDYNHPLAKI